jgi:hypothetical protein
METEQITVRVEAAAARAFRLAPREERQKLEALLSLRLSDATRTADSLTQVMSEISRRAQERGLTPEILRSILDEE